MTSLINQQSGAGQAEPKRLAAVTSGRGDGGSKVCVETSIRDTIKWRQNFFDNNFDVAFFLGDIEKVKRQYMQWKSLLPRVQPFYAMKACGEPLVLKLMADMGASFDCSSKGEMETVLKLGVDGSRIIFAHTIKPASSLQFASANKVTLMTFDNEDELEKIKKYFPGARLVLRIRCKESDCFVNFGFMFGCCLDDTERLLKRAQSLQLNVVGVSFHVGTGVSDPAIYEVAIEQAHDVFKIGKQTGFNFSLLDIGGGFIDPDDTVFKKVAEGVNSCLEKYFPLSTGVRIIAEPGRYMVSTAFTWVVRVIGKRSNDTFEEGVVYEDDREHKVSPRFIYYVSDGCFGAGRIKTTGMKAPKPVTHKGIDTSVTYSSLMFGPTCAPVDVMYRDISLPELQIGDWLYMENAGAYTMAFASDFSMNPRARCFYLPDEISL